MTTYQKPKAIAREAHNPGESQLHAGIVPLLLPFLFGGNMKKVVWLFVVRWIKNSFVGKEDQESSTIVDICMYLEDSFTRRGVKHGN